MGRHWRRHRRLIVDQLPAGIEPPLVMNREHRNTDAAEVARALEHPALARLATRLAARVPIDTVPWSGSRLAAVAAVLRVSDGPELLFIKRAETERDPWSGHIAFPGGRHEPRDASLEDTAVRETREEIDLDISGLHLIGRLDDVAPRSRVLPPIIIRPFIAVVAPDVVFTPNAEVADSFWTPLSWLRSREARTQLLRVTDVETVSFPAYAIREHIVWGLTERIVTQMLTLFDE